MWRVLGPILLAIPLVAADAPRSSYLDASPETRAMQDDDAANPGFLWVAQGEALWRRPEGPAGKACASCHRLEEMDGVAARYPVVEPATRRVVTLDARVRQCRTERQGAAEAGPDSEVMLALTALVGLRSRGQALRVSAETDAAQAVLAAGRGVFETRMGQLNLSCAQCHDGLAGQRLAGSTIPQGHPNGYPQYRLEWQGMGSLHRRIRNCTNGVRAERFAPDDPALGALMFFLAWRANGLPVETPAVRP